MSATPHDPPQLPTADVGDGRRFARLHALGRVGLRAEACLHIHRGYLGCDACEASCPQACLTRGDGALELDPTGCTACGLCAAACPTGALAIEGFGPGPTAPGRPVGIACEKAPNVPADARRVPCLGGLTSNDYLRLCLESDGAAVTVYDDGACERCATACEGANPGVAALEAAQWAIAAAGAPGKSLPRIAQTASLPNGNRAGHATTDTVPGSRRAFFTGLTRALVGGLGRPTGLFEPPRSVAARARVPVANPRGELARGLLEALARRHARHAPHSAMLARVETSDACRADGVCARACPTGALALVEAGSVASLQFEPWRCIDCGACERYCPEKALSQTPPRWSEFATAPVVLARVALRECPDCGATLAAADDRGLCDRCTKSRRLAQAGFALFHPAGREAPATRDPH